MNTTQACTKVSRLVIGDAGHWYEPCRACGVIHLPDSDHSLKAERPARSRLFSVAKPEERSLTAVVREYVVFNDKLLWHQRHCSATCTKWCLCSCHEHADGKP